MIPAVPKGLIFIPLLKLSDTSFIVPIISNSDTVFSLGLKAKAFAITPSY